MLKDLFFAIVVLGFGSLALAALGNLMSRSWVRKQIAGPDPEEMDLD